MDENVLSIPEFAQFLSNLTSRGYFDLSKLDNIKVKCSSCNSVVSGRRAFTGRDLICPNCNQLWAKGERA